MEDKIEVGEYVKLNYGKIDRVKDNDYYMQQYIECEKGLYPRKNIVKHSKNIIDLIEVGDYVNGHLVKAVYLEGTTKYIKLDNSHSIENNFAGIRTYKQDIKSIVTKEQFSSVAYLTEE